MWSGDSFQYTPNNTQEQARKLHILHYILYNTHMLFSVPVEQLRRMPLSTFCTLFDGHSVHPIHWKWVPDVQQHERFEWEIQEDKASISSFIAIRNYIYYCKFITFF